MSEFKVGDQVVLREGTQFSVQHAGVGTIREERNHLRWRVVWPDGYFNSYGDEHLAHATLFLKEEFSEDEIAQAMEELE